MGNHKVIFKTFVDAVLKRMRTAAKDDIFDWKKLGFAGAEKVANRLQAQVTENEDQTQFSVSCKEFRHEFKVEDTNFHYTREDESGKRKFQLKQFDELRAEFLKMKMEAAHLESMQGELELRRQEKALAELKWRETLRRNPKSVKLKRQMKKELRRLNQKYPRRRWSKSEAASSGTEGTESESSGAAASGAQASETEASETGATEEEASETGATEEEASETGATEEDASETGATEEDADEELSGAEAKASETSSDSDTE